MKIWKLWLGVSVIGLVVCAGSVSAIELADFSQFDRILNGVAWSEETEPYLSTNLATYCGSAWEGKMAKAEPSIDIGLLNYQDLTFDSLDDLVDYLKKNTIADITVNLVELGKMLPVAGYLLSKLPPYVYFGMGGGIRYEDSDWDFETKLVAAIKIKFE